MMLNTVSTLQWILIVSVLPVVNAESGRTIVDGVNMEKNIENQITGTLEIGMCGTRPFFFYDGSIKGSDVLILELLSKKMGFKYTTANGSLDIGFAQLSQLHHRYQQVDYLTTSAIYELNFQGSVPKETPPFKSLWIPFDHATWAFVVGTSIAAILTLFLIDKNWGQLVQDETKAQIHAFEAIWMILATIIEGGLPEYRFMMKSFVTRKFFLFQWLAFCFIMTEGYKDSLSALLITPVYLSPVNTVQDMINSESQFIVPGGTSVMTLLMIDPRSDVQKLYKMHLPVLPVVGGVFNDSVVNGLKDGRYTGLLPNTNKIIFGDDFHYGSQIVFNTHASPIVPKESPLKTLLDENLSWIKDTGLIQKMEADAVRGVIEHYKLRSKLPEIAGDRPLTVYNLSPGFAIWSVGVLLSVMVFLYEKKSGSLSKSTAGEQIRKLAFA